MAIRIMYCFCRTDILYFLAAPFCKTHAGMLNYVIFLLAKSELDHFFTVVYISIDIGLYVIKLYNEVIHSSYFAKYSIRINF